MRDVDGRVMGSARPRLMLFPDGPLLLSGGRPGLFIWVNAAADGEDWKRVNLARVHNQLATQGHRYCKAFVAAGMDEREEQLTTRRRWGHHVSTSYTSLVTTGRCQGMVMYDRNHRSVPQQNCYPGGPRRCIFALPFIARTGACAS